MGLIIKGVKLDEENILDLSSKLTYFYSVDRKKISLEVRGFRRKNELGYM